MLSIDTFRTYFSCNFLRKYYDYNLVVAKVLHCIALTFTNVISIFFLAIHNVKKRFLCKNTDQLNMVWFIFMGIL